MNKPPTMTWLIVLPDEMIANVLLTLVNNEGKRYVEMGAICSKDSPWPQYRDVVAYMVIPHMLDDAGPWKSEYWGDDAPDKGYCICCTEKDKRVRMLWFDGVDKYGGAEMIGYMAVPKPYTGKRRLEL